MKTVGTKMFTLIMFVLAFAGLAYYTYLNNQAGKQKEEAPSSEVEQLLVYDFENNYPKTVRETVKLHCNYLKNAYNEKFTDEELVVVNQKIRKLFDDELLALNSESAQLLGMQNEIALYKEKKQKLVGFSLAEGSQVEKNKQGDQEYAKMHVTLIIKVNSSTVEAEEDYILRKDIDGRWKILGWQMVNSETAGLSEGE